MNNTAKSNASKNNTSKNNASKNNSEKNKSSATDFVVISIDTLNLALPATELVLINEREKVTHQDGLMTTRVGNIRVPVYQFDYDLQICQGLSKGALYCAVFATSDKIPLWGTMCHQIERHPQRRPLQIPTFMISQASPLSGGIVDDQQGSHERWIFTTTTQALTHYLERSLSNDHENQPINMAC